jgi:ankyrin repeat protein
VCRSRDFVFDLLSRFRWVALQLNSLSACHSMWTLRKALDSLPPGLDETYSRILEKVNDHEKPRVRLMLQWLLFSLWPLRIQELADIFHVGDAIGPPFNADATVFRPEDILDMCPGLLSLTTITVQQYWEKGWKQFSAGTRLQIAELAHFSVKEYLLRTPHCPTWLALDQELAHLSILKSSMAYFMSVATKLRDDPQWRYRTWHELAISHSLAIYCGQYTQKHLLALSHGQREDPDLLESFRCLLNPHSRFTVRGFRPSYFDRLFMIKPNWPIHDERVPAAGVSLLIAAKLGLTKMVDWLISFGGDNCTEDDDVKCDINFVYMDGIRPCGPALAEASAQGHIEIVKLLLGDKYRARLDVDRGNAIRNAAACGHEEIVRLLIDAGADVNIPHPPIGFAGCSTDMNIINTLFSELSHLNENRNNATLLEAATARGQGKLVRMLIDAGANIRAVRGDGITALGVAAARGHEEIVKLLLDLGTNITQEMKTAALAQAKRHCHDTIAAMLLAAGAVPAEIHPEQRRKRKKSGLELDESDSEVD